MALAAWPAQLPQSPQKNYTESLGLGIVRSSMDSGVAKQRLRGKRADSLDLNFILTTAQVEILDDFIKDVLYGVKRFTFPHPRKTVQPGVPVTAEVRIVPSGDGEFFKTQYIAPGYFNVALKLEVLP